MGDFKKLICSGCNEVFEEKDFKLGDELVCPNCGECLESYVPIGEKKDTNIEKSPRQSISGYILVGLLCLVIGYFGGREHIRYELRQSLQSAVEEMQKGLIGLFSGSADVVSSNLQQGQKSDSLISKPKVPPIFKVALKKKDFRKENIIAGIIGAIIISVAFENLTNKDIRAFDGTIKFTDLLDNHILSAKLAINDPIVAKTTLIWDGEIEYNEFMDSHRRLRTMDVSSLKVYFKPRKLLFADGPTKQFE